MKYPFVSYLPKYSYGYCNALLEFVDFNLFHLLFSSFCPKSKTHVTTLEQMAVALDHESNTYNRCFIIILSKLKVMVYCVLSISRLLVLYNCYPQT